MVGLPELKPQQNRQPLLNIGIYSKTRNPIYFAHWLVVFSTAALSNFAANWIMFALEVVALPLLIRSEERELRARYGAEFMEYMRRVPRFFPHIR
jgi:protein-S-isoprenylcysteine O-methyltransferase Ste14